jgi:CMP-N-acetylneuraminic acid synthetase
VIAIIPARGGSQRIPKKNIKEFCGKPIIAYSIQTALRSRLFDQIIVSTDSPEIWKVAEAWGADTIVNRSVYASQDKIGTQAVAREVLEQWVDPMPAQT